MATSIRWLAPATAAVLLTAVPCSQAKSLSQKRALAQTQYSRAEKMQQELEATAEGDRSGRDYDRVIAAYQRVYLITPNFARTDASIFHAAELMQEKGSVLGDADASRDALKQYHFLMDQYPGTRFKPAAMFAVGETYQDLYDTENAKAAYEDFLKAHPQHPLSQQARDAIADLEHPKKPPAKAQVKRSAAAQSAAKSTPSDDEPSDDEDATDAVPSEPKTDSSKRVMVTGIRHWSTPNYTRVAIDLGDEVPYEAGRVPSPDRIFFDLHGTKLSSELFGKSIDVDDGFLKKIRVAQYQKGMTRIVLEVAPVSQYSAFFLPNPSRLIIDVHGRDAAGTSAPNGLILQKEPLKTAASQPATSVSPRAPLVTPDSQDSTTGTFSSSKPDASSQVSAAAKKEIPSSESSKSVLTAPLKPHTIASLQTAASLSTKAAANNDSELDAQATGHTTTAPTFEAVAPVPADPKPEPRAVQKSNDELSLVGREARPDADGERTLIRALGLKIGKIVVDAGHGGHDTGTIGPSGLMEKDLVLDVALRLGKLLEHRLGSDVVYTRSDDTFIPLETRTAIANQNQADLFISIHANSSDDPSARGVETYYLNFTSSPDALEVAARENAVSDQSIHELQDLVKKIALKEKIEESHEFAADVQRSLHSGLSVKHNEMRDRGVKKAPFIVLIGANMPSILAEISFVSNAKDERKLKTPDYREKIAESLYHGIADYVHGLSGIKLAKAGSAGQ